jgi:hypothetical protein
MIVRALDTSIQQLGLGEALTPGQAYSVIGIEADDYRLLNNAGRPFLYPASPHRSPAQQINRAGLWRGAMSAERFAEQLYWTRPRPHQVGAEALGAAFSTFWRAIVSRRPQSPVSTGSRQ